MQNRHRTKLKALQLHDGSGSCLRDLVDDRDLARRRINAARG
jgi:hypothetical protein